MTDKQPKRQKTEANSSATTQVPVAADKEQDVSKFLKSWAWKREHRPDRDRFHKPYIHPLVLPGGLTKQLSIKQAKFSAIGFASTVWDSSIVVAKYLEAHPELVQGKAVLDLSAGCGLVGIVAAWLGASRVLCTDLQANLPLLSDNCTANAVPDAPHVIRVMEHTWGEDVASLQPPFDVVLAQDVMYVREAVPALLHTLQRVCQVARQQPIAAEQQDPDGPCIGEASSGKGPVSCTSTHDSLNKRTAVASTSAGSGSQHVSSKTSQAADASPVCIVAHGRNRFAEQDFMEQAAAVYSVRQVTEAELHPDYQCSDVTMYCLQALS